MEKWAFEIQMQQLVGVPLHQDTSLSGLGVPFHALRHHFLIITLPHSGHCLVISPSMSVLQSNTLPSAQKWGVGGLVWRRSSGNAGENGIEFLGVEKQAEANRR